MSVEVTTKYVTQVDSLNQAFEYVMAHLDKLGAEPSIQIQPVWVYGEKADEYKQRFEVVLIATTEDDD